MLKDKNFEKNSIQLENNLNTINKLAESATKGNRESFKDLINFSTKNCYSFEAIISVLAKGSDLISNGKNPFQKQIGSEIFTNIAKYFYSEQSIFKKSYEEEGEITEERKINFSNNLQKVFNLKNIPNNETSIFILNLYETYLGIIKAYGNLPFENQSTIYINPFVKYDQKFIQESKALLKFMAENANEPDTADILFYPHLLKNFLENNAATIFNQKFGKYSLKDVYLFIESNDSDYRMQMNNLFRVIVDFTTNTPKGNLLWQYLNQSYLFYDVSYKRNTYDKENISNKIDLNIYDLRQYIADQLFLGGIITKENEKLIQSKDFDLNFSKYISQINKNSYAYIIKQLHLTSLFGVTHRNIIHPLENNNDHFRYNNLQRVAAFSYHTISGRRSMFLDFITQKLLNEKKEFIVRDLKKRFNNNNNNEKLFVNIIYNMLEINDYDELIKGNLYNLFEGNFGTGYIEKLAKRTNELEKLIDECYKEILISDKGTYFPHPETFNIISFKNNSLLTSLGFQEIVYSLNKDDSIDFSITLYNSEIAYIGSIGRNNIPIVSDIKLPTEMQGIEKLIQSIVMFSFHDFCMGIRLQNDEDVNNSVKEKSIVKTSKNNNKKRNNYRNVPRINVVKKLINYETGSNKITTDSENISNFVDVKKYDKNRIVRKIDAHRVMLPGINRYLNAVKELENYVKNNPQKEIPQEFKIELENARNNINKPSSEKVHNVPNTINLLTKLDPLTNQTIYLYTWRIAHESPKLTDEEKKFDVRWKKFYKGRSSLKFMNELIQLD